MTERRSLHEIMTQRHAHALHFTQCVHGISLLALCVWTYATLAAARSVAGFAWANHDVANTLYVGRAMAEHKRLYVDILELNPPGIFLFTECVERIAGLVRVSAFHVYHASVLLLALYGGWLLQRIARVRRRAELLTLVGLAHLLVVSGAGLPSDRGFVYSFGQREHLFALIFVPYIVWRLSGVCRDWTRYVVLSLVGLAASMKPQFMILVVAMELIWHSDAPAMRRRDWTVLTISASAPYVLLLVHSPKSFVALWTETLRYHTGGTYAAFNQPYSTYVHSPQHPWLVAYAAALAYFLWSLWRSDRLARGVRISSIVVPVLSYLLVVQQRKFWAYHSIVVASVLLVLVAYLASQLVLCLPRDRRIAWMALLVAAMLAGLRSTFTARESLVRDWKSDSGEMASVLRLAPLLGRARSVLYYSTSIFHMRLAYSLDQRIVGKKCHDFDYPAMVRDPDPIRRSRRISAFCDEQKKLVVDAQPDAVVFFDTGQGLERKGQEEHSVLVDQCHAFPAQLYSKVLQPDLPQVHLYLRREH